ncbi:MAG TPA: outer membrane lipoprotein-sorting protein [Bryobacteraceae bacterium]|nr:outer membrane lipoprotein-sorting protein [Bryobacteraceae bacterium]
MLLACTLSAAAPDAAELLRRFDATRNGWDTYVVRVNIRNFEEGKKDEEHLYEVSQKGTDKSYIEFLSPREKGRHLLMLGDDMWIYLPDTSRPIRITPLERLTGNASNGDVARTSYTTDYDPVFLRTETVNGAACHVLELTARRKGATYRKIHLWLRASDARPVKADFFVASGKQLKSATYDRYQEVGGRVLLRQMTIYDQVRKGSHSVMEYIEYTPRSLPDRMFHQGRSERF